VVSTITEEDELECHPGNQFQGFGAKCGLPATGRLYPTNADNAPTNEIALSLFGGSNENKKGRNV
jgi:hypothetical protein